MKYFSKGKTENGYGAEGITLGEKVFSLCKEDGIIIIREECDGYFTEELSPEDAIEMFNEAIDWIKDNKEYKNNE